MAADLNRAQQQKEQAEKSLDRHCAQLQQKGAASHSEVAAAEQRLAVGNCHARKRAAATDGRYSTTDRSKVQAQLNDARASVAAAQNSYRNANIRSPLAGTVYSIPVTAYDFVHGRPDPDGCRRPQSHPGSGLLRRA